MPPLMCPVDVQLWIQARFVQEGWREGHQELLTKLQTQRLCRYTVNMRVSCVGGCVDESAYLAARGPLETVAPPTATKLVLQLQFLLWFLYSVSMCGVRFVGGIVGAAGAVVSALTL